MNSELINKIKTDGIIRLENFLNKEELSDLQKIVKFYSAPKSSKNSYWPTNSKLLLYKILDSCVNSFEALNIRNQYSLI